MKSAVLFSLACLSQSAYSLTLNERDEPSTLGFNFERRNASTAMQKRGTASADLVSEYLEDQNLYNINLTIGTPGVTIAVGLDTGSSDLWVNSPHSTYCILHSDKCKGEGTYNPNDSSTYKLVNHDFYISYVDGSESAGDYVNDTVKFGNATLEDFQFAVGYKTTESQGILGVGYKGTESVVDGASEYANFPFALTKQGIINSPAYSLWLDDLDAHKGQILFGGVNTAKYTGELHSLPVIPNNGVYNELQVNLTGVTSVMNGNKTSFTEPFPLPAVLDSGSTSNSLPADVANEILAQVGTFDIAAQAWLVDCDLANSKDSNITFSFGDLDLTIDISELVLDLGDNICELGIDPSSDGSATLGDTFLRSVYAVYDLANNEISLAPANFNPGEDHILEIGTGSSAVPTVTGAPAATATSTSSTAEGPSSSKGAGAFVTADSRVMAAGIAGAGLFLAL